MIRYLKARGHKGISELKLMDLDHINIICGKNNSGKTSILEALASPENRGLGKEIDAAAVDSIKNTFYPRIQQYATPPASSIMTCFEKALVELLKDDPVKFNDETGLIDTQIHGAFERDQYLSRYNVRFNITDILNSLFTAEEQGFKPILIPPKRVLETNTAVQFSAPILPSGSGLINRLFYLKNQSLESHEFETYKQIHAAFKDITGYEFNIIPDPANNISAHFRGDSLDWIRSDACGLGLSDVLVIIYFVCIRDYNWILIEEPESHIHPDMQRKLLYFFQTLQEKQFILTTHSNVFLNNALVDRVFFSSLKDNVQISDVTSRASILDDLGYSVADNIVSDLVVLVEGPTDVPVLEEYLIKMQLFNKYNIRIWPLGGDIMDQLELKVFCENYKVIALIDRDFDSRRVRNRFKRKCDENNIEVVQLRRYSIENYFTLRALRAVFGQQIPDTINHIEPKTKLEKQIGMNVKNNNRRLAQEMTLEEIKEADDLYRFLLRVDEVCQSEHV